MATAVAVNPVFAAIQRNRGMLLPCAAIALLMVILIPLPPAVLDFMLVLNLTLSAAAEALDGLGTKFGQSIVNGNAVLDDVNPQMPQIRTNIQQLSKLADVYTKASPDLWDFLDHAVVTARTLNAEQKDLDAALLASTGFGNTGADIFERGGPYFVRGQADLIPTAKLLDTYSPQLFSNMITASFGNWRSLSRISM